MVVIGVVWVAAPAVADIHVLSIAAAVVKADVEVLVLTHVKTHAKDLVKELALDIVQA